MHCMSGGKESSMWKKILISGLVIPFAAFYFGIWHAYFSAFHLYSPEISEETVQSSRTIPNELEAKIADMNTPNLIIMPVLSGNVEAEADQLLNGRLNIDDYPRLDKNDPFNDEIALTQSSNWRLAYSGFIIPQIYLNAFKTSGEDKYLNAALEYVIQWEDKERKNWSHIGLISNDNYDFVWNEHAVAMRSDFLIDFWLIYKDHHSFDVETGKKLLSLTARYASFLSRDINLQNVSVLKMIVFFNEVKAITDLRPTVVENINKQINYLLSDEGVILANSAGYQAIMMQLVSNTIQLSKLANIELPENLMDRYKMGLNYLMNLRRSDGTFPKYGDTDGGYDNEIGKLISFSDNGESPINPRDISWRPDSNTTIKSNSGYALWWYGLEAWPNSSELSQTTISWSYFPYLPHFHSDDLSFSIWKGGQDWWSSAGYWPYSDSRRIPGTSWTTSNAPHLVGENMNSERSTSILSDYDNQNMNFIEISRTNTDGLEINRQIFKFEDAIWIIVDSFSDANNRKAEIVWNLNDKLVSQSVNENTSVEVGRDGLELEMRTFFHGSSELEVTKVRGSNKPLAGWNTQREEVIPADAYIVNVNSNDGWTINTSVIDQFNNETGNPTIVKAERNSKTSWLVEIDHHGSIYEISRDNETLTVQNLTANQTVETATIQKHTGTNPMLSKVRDHYLDAGEQHGRRLLTLMKYRKKMSMAVLGLILANLIVIYFVRRFKLLSQLTVAASGLFFVVLYYWLANSYFIL